MKLDVDSRSRSIPLFHGYFNILTFRSWINDEGAGISCGTFETCLKAQKSSLGITENSKFYHKL